MEKLNYFCALPYPPRLHYNTKSKLKLKTSANKRPLTALLFPCLLTNGTGFRLLKAFAVIINVQYLIFMTLDTAFVLKKMGFICSATYLSIAYCYLGMLFVFAEAFLSFCTNLQCFIFGIFIAFILLLSLLLMPLFKFRHVNTVPLRTLETITGRTGASF